LFGATGFTGGLTAEYLARSASRRPLRWALAGRNRQKLEQVRAKLGAQAASVELLEADATDDVALGALARSTRVMISTVGPYLQHGEPLVRACTREGADYVDLTGEWVFVDHMLERYHELAAQNRVRIVHSCGFDSIPYDLGTYFTIKKLGKRVGSLDNFPVMVECFVRASGGISGGTWQSGLGIMADMLRHERGKAERQAKLPQVGRERVIRELPMRMRFRKELGLWTLPMPSIDPQVVCRSARLLPAYGHDFRYGHNIALPNLAQAVGAVVGVSTLFTLAQFGPARRLLMKLRKPGAGPSESTRQKGWFHVVLLGYAASHEVRCEVSGGDPGYTETAKMLAESALCLAFDRDRLPAHYGVVPPAAAMGDALLERLINAGIRFEDKSSDDVKRIQVRDALREERNRSKAN
jgi:short subunit dehydrogenase-like uncharacterized protein